MYDSSYNCGYQLFKIETIKRHSFSVEVLELATIYFNLSISKITKLGRDYHTAMV